ncbi:hypothetical protein K488DRAFT_82311 [Vararia minispora EC-137]|uniref:Uncharacterized protein n=1 Tax=Vararia minispora EC-137 TaxID=1314806 RepID=A0ACB8QXB0_9AGAM|nr:hypothetical protein K488DRAFT_82311 [Vararia minispora EC-137]
MHVPYDPNFDYTRELKNYLQATGQIASLQWAHEQVGQNDRETHIMTAYRTHALLMNGQPLGTGRATTKNGAKKPASYHALVALGQI